MDEEKKHYYLLSLVMLIISGLLTVKYVSSLSLGNYTINTFIEIVGIIWPIMGISTAYEFLRKDRDKWGWGGIMFHFVMLYCMIYVLILVIQAAIQFSINFEFFLNLSISVLAWLGYLLYYD